MNTASLTIAALALSVLAAAAPRAAAQTETVQTSSESVPGRPSGSEVGKEVYKSGQHTATGVAPQVPANAADVNRGARGTSVATGFVAAGVGLAILGLFVRKRGRHEFRDEDPRRGPGPDERL